MQVSRVVVLVERVDNHLPVDRHFPDELLDELHVLHSIGAEVGHDLPAEPLVQRRRAARAGQSRPDPAAPLGALDRGCRQPVQLAGVEVLAVGDTDDGALQVVDPAVPAAGEPARASRALLHDPGTPVLADVMEAGDTTVAAPAHNDRLAVPLPPDEVPRIGYLGRAADDLPAVAQHGRPLPFVALGIGIDSGIDDPWPDIRNHRDTRTEADRGVTASGHMNHGISLWGRTRATTSIA